MNPPLSQDELAELREWLSGLPDACVELVRQFPPGSIVYVRGLGRAHVCSYTEDGCLGVTVDLCELAAQVKPEAVVVVARSELGEVIERLLSDPAVRTAPKRVGELLEPGDALYPGARS